MAFVHVLISFSSDVIESITIIDTDTWLLVTVEIPW